MLGCMSQEDAPGQPTEDDHPLRTPMGAAEVPVRVAPPDFDKMGPQELATYFLRQAAKQYADAGVMPGMTPMPGGGAGLRFAAFNIPHKHKYVTTLRRIAKVDLDKDGVRIEEDDVRVVGMDAEFVYVSIVKETHETPDILNLPAIFPPGMDPRTLLG